MGAGSAGNANSAHMYIYWKEKETATMSIMQKLLIMRILTNLFTRAHRHALTCSCIIKFKPRCEIIAHTHTHYKNARDTVIFTSQDILAAAALMFN